MTKRKTPLWAYLLALPVWLVALPFGLILLLVVLVEGLLHRDPYRAIRVIIDGFRGGKLG